MSKYFAGIEPLEKGYETISIEPQFGNLKKIEAAVSTIKGNIKLQAEKSENEVFLHMTVPAKTRVAIPKLKDDSKIIVNEKTVYKKGKPKKKIKAPQKIERPKKKRKAQKKKINKKGNATISFSTLVLQSSTLFFM